MFGAIAKRYDFLNHFLSANCDRVWRKRCVREIVKRNHIASPKILDIGCGTADLSIAFSGLGTVIGCDFCHEMLVQGAEKAAKRALRFPITLLEADALALPFSDSTFDIVVSAFVLRNLADIDCGLAEMKRVLRPGGILGVLDFGMPDMPIIRRIYRWYFLKALPRLGQWISGAAGAYQYLPSSVQTFPAAEELRRKAEQAGFSKVECRRITAGIAVLLSGQVPDF